MREMGLSTEGICLQSSRRLPITVSEFLVPADVILKLGLRTQPAEWSICQCTPELAIYRAPCQAVHLPGGRAQVTAKPCSGQALELRVLEARTGQERGATLQRMTRDAGSGQRAKVTRRGKSWRAKDSLFPLSTNWQGHTVPPLHIRPMFTHPEGTVQCVSSPCTLQSSGPEEASLWVNFSFVDGPNVPSLLSI